MAKTPGSVGSKKNTLFNYFTKTPPVGKLGSEKPCPQSAPSKKTPFQKLDLKFAAGDLTWAKMEGHPWWPSLVFNHPKDNDTRRKDGSSYLVNVQFFGEKPSRGWVKERFVKPFNGSDSKDCRRGGTYFSSDRDWKFAVQEADKALKLKTAERLKLIVAVESSDDDDEDDDNSDVMEVDDERGDDVSPESGCKTDKENKSPPESTPSKGRERSTRRPQSKRRRIVESDDDAAVDCFSPEDSCQPAEGSGSSSSGEEELVEEVDDDDDDKMSCDDEEDLPKNRKRKRNGESKSAKKEKSPKRGVTRKESTKKTSTKKKDDIVSTPKRYQLEVSVKSKLSAYSATSTVQKEVSSSSSAVQTPLLTSGGDDDRTFPHTSLKFLQPDKIKDANRKGADDPDYDPRTLHVPDDFLSKQTPAMRQWWALKSQYHDTILFFKMGKFYELFHMDAVIGVNELGLLFMKGDHAHCGFPEISYGRFSDILIQKGYKVGRVEQTETPDQMLERCKQSKSSSKFDKVVRREVCSVQSRGTKKSSFIDGDCCHADHNFLLAISEKIDSCESTYGVCFVDVMIGTFHVGQFEDDRHGSRLRTLVSHFPPSQVLYEKGKLSEKTRNVFNSCLSQSDKEGLRSGVEFWDGSKTLKVLSEADYFVVDDEGMKWPRVLDEMVSKEDSLGLTPRENFSLGLSALGAVTWYLRHCLMDDELLSLRSFEIYTPVDATPEPSREVRRDGSSVVTNKRMVLDGVTLLNLDVIVNSSTGTSEGTLLQKLDSCKTPFGKRLFKQWLCSPLCNIDSINDRLNAMEDIMSAADVVSKVSAILSKLPDLERLLNKIHTLSLSRRSKNHPDSRAVFFEDVIYNKRKIEDFITCLEGFKSAKSIVEKFEDSVDSFKSNLLKSCITLKDSRGMFPDLQKQLDFFDDSFDHQEAKKKGVIKPAKGVNKDYDNALSDIGSCEEELEECLQQLKKLLNCKTLTYFGTAKNRYQAEVPESLSGKMPKDYDLTSQRKGFKRYQNQKMQRIFGRLVDAEERRDAAQKDTMRCIFEKFDKHHTLWTEALHCLCILDILLSLANYSSQSGLAMCRPEFVTNGNKSILEIRNGCHPCVERNVSGSDFIPNDTVIGAAGDESSSSSHVLLVTGPNMGGKSTLMRQVGLICILAQLGCYVPAELCRLSPVDRIFTRLGASDHIMSGESTFFVELSETSCVLRHATENSLVLLDELGRGTATYDGNAIATAVLQELADSIQCRTIFSTHYHSIVDKFSSNPRVSLGHMACMVENEDDDDPCQETITFLFKLAPGNCPKSYGFNAAKLAGISPQIIREAHLKAKEFEESTRIVQLFRNLWSLKQDESDKLKSLIAEIN